MRVIARKMLREFWENHRDAEGAFKAWLAEAERAEWETSQDILDRFSYVDIIPGNRAVFNIKGNHYRLEAISKSDRYGLILKKESNHGHHRRTMGGGANASAKTNKQARTTTTG
jgi:mRNA interferase HigB